MLIISIIVLVFIAAGIYLMTKKSSVTAPVASVDVPAVPTVDEEALKKSQLDALAEAQKAKVEVDAVIAKADEAMAKADEVLSKAPAVEAPAVTENATIEASIAESKPKKKKRYYKPKAKK